MTTSHALVCVCVCARYMVGRQDIPSPARVNAWLQLFCNHTGSMQIQTAKLADHELNEMSMSKVETIEPLA